MIVKLAKNKTSLTKKIISKRMEGGAAMCSKMAVSLPQVIPEISYCCTVYLPDYKIVNLQ